MSSSATASLPVPDSTPARSDARYILSFVFFTFICYLSIGLPLAVLPIDVHLRMGYSTMLAGLAISVQYVATLASRPWAGRISDHLGAKVAVLWGMAACTCSGALLIGVAALHSINWLSFVVLIVSRLVLGVGESLGATGSTLWGISATGHKNTARVIGFNGISTYGGIGLGAPLGVILDRHWGLTGIGVMTILIAGASFALALRKSSVFVEPGEHLPFKSVLGRVAPHGMGLALGGISYSVLASFVTLFYASRHWNGAALCLTAFGVAFVIARIFFIGTINAFGGFTVAKASLLIEAFGTVLLWQANSPWMALAGAAVCGFGLSLIFPAIGVEAVKRVPEFNRGTALGVYTAFSDVSFFLVGPVAGALIGFYGYASVFLFALVSILVALGIVFVLRHIQHE
jgi:MFS family permease